MSGFFYTRDHVPLEIEYHAAGNPRSCLIVWPCMAGSFRMYRVPVESFTACGISVLLYNPRAHGKSEGQITLKNSIDDLAFYMHENPLPDIPIAIMGHSAGANAALKYATRSGDIARFYLTAPVLDSTESLEYMYERGTINEFNVLIAQMSCDPGFVLSVLKENRWLDTVYWKNENLRQRLDAASGTFRIGSFLEGLFLPTHNSFDDLALHGNITTLMLSTDDHWYPRRRIDELCDRYGIRRHIIPGALDHFFTDAWKELWNRLIRDLTENPPSRITSHQDR